VHAVHEMHPIVTEERGVCKFVCLFVTRLSSVSFCKNVWTDQEAVWGENSWGPRNIVLYGGPRRISRKTETGDLKFCGILTKTVQKYVIGDRVFKFGTPLMSPEWLKLEI